MTEVILSLAFSGTALLISALTAWATLFRRGSLAMTQPTVIFFGPDGSGLSNDTNSPKIYLRTLIFSTGKRGHMIESMHVKLTRNETVQNFNIWVYGDDRLQRGSGLFVGESGVTSNRHFLMPKDGQTFKFVSGAYNLQVYARRLRARKDDLLWSQELLVGDEQSKMLKNQGTGMYFDWGPDSKKYLSHIEEKPPLPSPSDLLGILPPISDDK